MIEMLEEMGENGFLYKQEEIFKQATNIDELISYLDDERC